MIMAADNPSIAEKREFTERDALVFAYESEEVAKFFEQGSLLEKIVGKVLTSDLGRLKKEYPSLFPDDIYQNPDQFQIFAITFIRGRNLVPGYTKLKIYVEMTGRRVLKIMTTS